MLKPRVEKRDDALSRKVAVANKPLSHVRIYEYADWYFSPNMKMTMGPTKFGVEWIHPPDCRFGRQDKYLGHRRTLPAAVKLAVAWDCSW